jgi:hypothetical protein
MNDWVEKVITKWRSEGVKLNPPATALEIEKTGSVLGFKFPDDFKQLYLAANGFVGLDWQEHMFTFWPLKMIVEEYEEDNAKNFIGFSDFLLASNFIGFNKNRNGVFKKYSQLYSNLEDGELIANTFEQVVDMINSSNDLIY